MLLALATSVVLLALAGGCAHRLWHAPQVWQALAFLPPIAATWVLSLLVREPTDGGALLTFLTGDIALFGLSVLGVMRMLGGLPPGEDGDGPWGSGDDDVDPEGGPVPPAGPGVRDGRERHRGARRGLRRRREAGVRRAPRKTWKSSGRNGRGRVIFRPDCDSAPDPRRMPSIRKR